MNTRGIACLEDVAQDDAPKVAISLTNSHAGVNGVGRPAQGKNVAVHARTLLYRLGPRSIRGYHAPGLIEAYRGQVFGRLLGNPPRPAATRLH